MEQSRRGRGDAGRVRLAVGRRDRQRSQRPGREAGIVRRAPCVKESALMVARAAPLRLLHAPDLPRRRPGAGRSRPCQATPLRQVQCAPRPLYSTVFQSGSPRSCRECSAKRLDNLRRFVEHRLRTLILGSTHDPIGVVCPRCGLLVAPEG